MDFNDLLKKLGLNSTQIQWRWMAFTKAASTWWEGLGTRREQLAYQNKVCPGCGNIVGATDQFCPICGAAAPSRAAELARKVLPAAVPRGNTVTLAILAVIVLNEILGILAFGWSNLSDPASTSLRAQGAMVPLALAHGEWWRMITAGYLHIGRLHILFNSIAVYQLGMMLEPELGSTRFFTVYTLSLLGGTLADALLRPAAGWLSAGASGALFGLIGIGLAYCHFNGNREGRDFFRRWALYNVIFCVLGHSYLDNYAHGGGFVTGLALGWVLSKDMTGRRTRDRLWSGAASVCFLLTLAAMGWMARGLLVDRMLQQAADLLLHGDAAASLRVLDRAMLLAPKNTTLWIDRGLAHDNEKQSATALADFAHAVEVAPTEPGPYFYRALAWCEQEQWKPAVTDFRAARQRGASEEAVASRIALAEENLGDYQAAIADYTVAIRVNEANDRLYYHRGLCFMSLHRHAEAARDFEVASHTIAEAREALMMLQQKR